VSGGAEASDMATSQSWLQHVGHVHVGAV
jgi:hypothetical protein